MSSIDRALVASGAFATRFSREFSAMVSDRNFSSEYLARRCRTTAEEISSWKTGVSAPSVEAWEYLCRADRGFLSLYDAWRESSSSRSLTLDPESISDLAIDVHGQAFVDTSKATLSGSELVRGADAESPHELSRPPLLAEESAPSALADARLPGESGSADLVDYVCKIGRGKFIRLGLPVAMTRAEAERICAFIMTQVD